MSIPSLHALTLHGAPDEPDRECDIGARNSTPPRRRLGGPAVTRVARDAFARVVQDLNAASGAAKRGIAGVRRRETAVKTQAAAFPETADGMVPNNQKELLDDLTHMLEGPESKGMPWSSSYEWTPARTQTLQEREVALCEALVDVYGDPNRLGVGPRRRGLTFLHAVGQAGSEPARSRTAFDAYQWLVAADLIQEKGADGAPVPEHVKKYRESVGRLRESHADIAAGGQEGDVHPFDTRASASIVLAKAKDSPQAWTTKLFDTFDKCLALTGSEDRSTSNRQAALEGGEVSGGQCIFSRFVLYQILVITHSFWSKPESGADRDNLDTLLTTLTTGPTHEGVAVASPWQLLRAFLFARHTSPKCQEKVARDVWAQLHFRLTGKSAIGDRGTAAIRAGAIVDEMAAAYTAAQSEQDAEKVCDHEVDIATLCAEAIVLHAGLSEDEGGSWFGTSNALPMVAAALLRNCYTVANQADSTAVRNMSDTMTTTLNDLRSKADADADAAPMDVDAAAGADANAGAAAADDEPTGVEPTGALAQALRFQQERTLGDTETGAAVCLMLRMEDQQQDEDDAAKQYKDGGPIELQEFDEGRDLVAGWTLRDVQAAPPELMMRSEFALAMATIARKAEAARKDARRLNKNHRDADAKKQSMQRALSDVRSSAPPELAEDRARMEASVKEFETMVELQALQATLGAAEHKTYELILEQMQRAAAPRQDQSAVRDAAAAAAPAASRDGTANRDAAALRDHMVRRATRQNRYARLFDAADPEARATEMAEEIEVAEETLQRSAPDLVEAKARLERIVAELRAKQANAASGSGGGGGGDDGGGGGGSGTSGGNVAMGGDGGDDDDDDDDDYDPDKDSDGGGDDDSDSDDSDDSDYDPGKDPDGDDGDDSDDGEEGEEEDEEEEEDALAEELRALRDVVQAQGDQLAAQRLKINNVELKAKLDIAQAYYKSAKKDLNKKLREDVEALKAANALQNKRVVTAATMVDFFMARIDGSDDEGASKRRENVAKAATVLITGMETFHTLAAVAMMCESFQTAMLSGISQRYVGGAFCFFDRMGDCMQVEAVSGWDKVFAPHNGAWTGTPGAAEARLLDALTSSAGVSMGMCFYSSVKLFTFLHRAYGTSSWGAVSAPREPLFPGGPLAGAGRSQYGTPADDSIVEATSALWQTGATYLFLAYSGWLQYQVDGTVGTATTVGVTLAGALLGRHAASQLPESAVTAVALLWNGTARAISTSALAVDWANYMAPYVQSAIGITASWGVYGMRGVDWMRREAPRTGTFAVAVGVYLAWAPAMAGIFAASTALVSAVQFLQVARYSFVGIHFVAPPVFRFLGVGMVAGNVLMTGASISIALNMYAGHTMLPSTLISRVLCPSGVGAAVANAALCVGGGWTIWTILQAVTFLAVLVAGGSHMRAAIQELPPEMRGLTDASEGQAVRRGAEAEGRHASERRDVDRAKAELRQAQTRFDLGMADERQQLADMRVRRARGAAAAQGVDASAAHHTLLRERIAAQLPASLQHRSDVVAALMLAATAQAYVGSVATA